MALFNTDPEDVPAHIRFEIVMGSINPGQSVMMALGDPSRYLRASRLDTLVNDANRAESERFVLRQLHTMIERAEELLNEFDVELVRLDQAEGMILERARARSHLADLDTWILEQTRLRSGEAPDPRYDRLDIPAQAIVATDDLEETGIELNDFWRQAMRIKEAKRIASEKDLDAEFQVKMLGESNKRSSSKADHSRSHGARGPGSLTAESEETSLPWRAIPPAGELLTDWKSIFRCVGARYSRSKKDWIAKENKLTCGPIVPIKRSVQVFENQLKVWWFAIEQRAIAAMQGEQARGILSKDHPLELSGQGLRTKGRRKGPAPGSDNGG